MRPDAADRDRTTVGVTSNREDAGMFTCSDDAATLIRSRVDGAKLPDGSGLRLVLNVGTQSLLMSLAARPHAADEVHVHGDVCVFAASGAATRLDQQTLHAQVTGRRRTFYLHDA